MDMVEITKHMKISEIENYSKAVEKLAEKGMFCLGCDLAASETLEQGAIAHGLNIDELVNELNLQIKKKKK